ncbi:MFS transporter [Paenactinomyces guangxiensis]|uniref:MFS transporter n=1 Tax=Paenactinomyces guangxiensis TaxID=1490290 RepID=UPI001E3A31D7|nr:MFS transporter [Paenactinomyces guangxiensis]
MVKPVHTESIWKKWIFIRMFSAYSISIFGVYLDLIAVSVLVGYTWKADPFLVSLIPITYALPGILLGSWAGVAADRLKKIHIMIAADILIAIVTFLLMFVPNIYWLLFLLTLRSAFTVFFYPAQQSLTKRVVREELLTKATALNGLLNQAGKIVGPLAGGMLITVISPQACMAIKAVNSLCSALILLSAGKVEEGGQSRTRTEKAGKNGHLWGTWLEGWKYVLKRKIIFLP